MFFSPEYLTSRPYGVGTVWLAATVGTHNIHHKISRKDIMAVQIPAACQSFIEPDVPLALRFQSNLLCGVVRVFNEQCRYMLIDTGQAVNNIRRSHTAAQASRALVLEDDPAFDTDLAIDIPMLYPGSLTLVEDNSAVAGSFFTNDSGNDPLPLSSAFSSTCCTIHPLDQMHQNFAPQTSSAVLLDDLGFEFDQYRYMQEASSPQLPQMLPDLIPDVEDDVRARNRERSSRSDSLVFTGITGMEHQEGHDRTVAGSQGPNTYTSPDVSVSINSPHQLASSQDIEIGDVQPESPQLVGDEGVARNARKGHSRAIPKGPVTDNVPQFKTTEVILWTQQYLENMEAAVKKRRASKISRLAKQNAHTRIFKWSVFGELRHPILQNMFSGEAILESIQKGNESTEKRKRGIEGQKINGEEEEGRRVRARSDIYEDDGFLLRSETGLGLPESEVGRKGSDLGSEGYHPSSQQSLPWAKGDIPESRPESHQLSIGGFPSSSFGGDLQGLSSTQRSHQSSPLAAKAIRRISILQSPIGERDEDLDMPKIDATKGSVDIAEQFESFNLGANSEAETDNSVEKDCLDFFNFLGGEIHKLDSRNADEEIAEHPNLITLEHLIDPRSNKPEVAASAFAHLLLLGTKGLVSLSQEEAYGTIQISIV
ncbi:hypothetical protein L873DRAFT_1847829 [Choiromyces venosus 120613-1]|uniref:Rad21/Rec8-like protein N-terminal domain-containing protein n=1 Tax=Choiromyces venosus 120613-1 TaxID=1336337 RepID=A0A3N4J1Q5_9PEZI|nr:hypothetical protein L873DRAFT_1847829 [Choiromyces venosus 120613-1]